MGILLPDLEAIEDLIVSTAAAVSGVSSSTPVGAEAEIRMLVKKRPAVFVMFEGDSWPGTSMLLGENAQEGGLLRWLVFVACNSMRGIRGGRKGDIGAYKLSSRVAERLEGLEVEPGYYLKFRGRDWVDLGDPSAAVMLCRFDQSADFTADE